MNHLRLTGMLCLILASIFTSNVRIYAQDKDYYQKQLEHLFEPINKSLLETNLLSDLSFPYKGIVNFNGSNEQNISLDLGSYQLVYMKLYSMLSGTTTLKEPYDYSTLKHTNSSKPIPIQIL